MLYEDAMNEDTLVSAGMVAREIEKHGLVAKDFFDEVGQMDLYRAKDVLEWLGY